MPGCKAGLARCGSRCGGAGCWRRAAWGRGFAHEPFMAALREVARDVEIVIDQTTDDPARGVPYSLVR
ncbi:hypothetical protein ACU4GD_12295 [Cupriavidus basilensis]